MTDKVEGKHKMLRVEIPSNSSYSEGKPNKRGRKIKYNTEGERSEARRKQQK